MDINASEPQRTTSELAAINRDYLSKYCREAISGKCVGGNTNDFMN